VSSKECILTLKAHTNSVWSVAFSFDGKQLASCSFDQTVRIWDISTGECSQVLQGHTALRKYVQLIVRGFVARCMNFLAMHHYIGR
jgi:WD40 repeat protein